jgi:hypothetical protein
MDGVQRRGVITAIAVSVAITAIVLGEAPIHDTWGGAQQALVTGPRIAGAVLLALLYFGYNAVRIPTRSRHLQPHPSSSVSFAGLVETRRAGAGG